MPLVHWNCEADAGGDSGASGGQAVQKPASVAPVCG